jgi:hypothetical protein
MPELFDGFRLSKTGLVIDGVECGGKRKRVWRFTGQQARLFVFLLCSFAPDQDLIFAADQDLCAFAHLFSLCLQRTSTSACQSIG